VRSRLLALSKTHFANAYLHYAKANDDTSFKDQHTRPLWLRGTAVLGRLNQQITDRGLPIHHTWTFWLRGTAVLGQLN
jgi:hypothetical protein